MTGDRFEDRVTGVRDQLPIYGETPIPVPPSSPLCQEVFRLEWTSGHSDQTLAPRFRQAERLSARIHKIRTSRFQSFVLFKHRCLLHLSSKHLQQFDAASFITSFFKQEKDSASSEADWFPVSVVFQKVQGWLFFSSRSQWKDVCTAAISPLIDLVT